MFRVTAFAMLLTVSAGAWATQDQPRLALADGGFSEQRAQIEADLADGETYAEISNMDRSTVRELLQRISTRLESVASLDELTDEEKALLFNDQEQVNVILTQAASDSRQVCRHEAATGTRFKKTRCYTVAERRRRMEQDQDDLRRSQNGIGPLQE
jgi:hypothetical protein